jgi:hypothetical protein
MLLSAAEKAVPMTADGLDSWNGAVSGPTPNGVLEGASNYAITQLLPFVHRVTNFT